MYDFKKLKKENTKAYNEIERKVNKGLEILKVLNKGKDKNDR